MEQETAGLVRRMAEGDSQAFDRLMEFYYPKILRMAYLISGSHADSEDIVQETFVLCWMNRKKIKEPEYFGNWLYKTLTRKPGGIAGRTGKNSRWRKCLGRKSLKQPQCWRKS